MPIVSLPADRLRWTLPADALRFSGTDELPPDGTTFGQEAFLEALAQGVALGPHHHVYVTAPPETEAAPMVCECLEARHIRPRRPARDLVYVQDPAEHDRPRLLELRPGSARTLEADMAGLAAWLLMEVPRVLGNLDPRRVADRVVLEQERLEAIAEVAARAGELGLTVELPREPEEEPQVLLVVEETPLPRSEVEWKVARGQLELELPIEELRTRLDQVEEALTRVGAAFRARALEKALQGARHERAVVDEAITPRFQAVARRHRSARAWLEALRRFVTDRYWLLLDTGEAGGLPPAALRGGLAEERWRPGHDEDLQGLLSLFQVHVFHSGRRRRTAPVVRPDRPTAWELFGGLPMEGSQGRKPDWRDLAPGLAVAAHGGFLVLDAEEIVAAPACWSALKRLLLRGELEARGVDGGPAAPLPRPQPVPLDLKVVLVGSDLLHGWLYATDPEFRRLFPVKAELDDAVPLAGDAAERFAAWVGHLVRRRHLRHVDRGGVEALLGWSVRRAERPGRVDVQSLPLTQVLAEATNLAGGHRVTAEDVEAAVARRRRWHGQAAERLREAIRQDRIEVQVEGRVTGQVNGIALYQSGPVSFGRPLRVTASVGTGRGGLVNVEREAGLSGRIHDKGVQILAGLVRGRYGRGRTLALTASICLEQSYGRIDGDSASAAEASALLSAIAQIPLRQEVAVTGSMDQLGHVQAVGGVNDKVEAFHQHCVEAGLTGTQGVVIPATNVPDLHLSEAVVADVAAGRFHVWAVSTLDDVLALLTGREPGAPGEDGRFPEGTFHRAVEDALDRLQEVVWRARRGRKAGR